MPAALVSRYSIDLDAVIDLEASLLGEPGLRPHADAGDDEVGGDAFAALERHGLAVDGGGARVEVKDDAVPLVDRLHHVAELRPQHALERPRLGTDDVHLEPALA